MEPPKDSFLFSLLPSSVPPRKACMHHAMLLYAMLATYILACNAVSTYSSHTGRPMTWLQLDNAGLAAAAAMHRERVT